MKFFENLSYLLHLLGRFNSKEVAKEKNESSFFVGGFKNETGER